VVLPLLVPPVLTLMLRLLPSWHAPLLHCRSPPHRAVVAAVSLDLEWGTGTL
jgi:hypothetical protein